MPASPSRTSPRPYLPATRRRDHLLAAAGRLVRAGGWPALSMQGLAAAAGVSRQLVYEHFGSTDDLHLATLTHLFERAYAATEAITRSGSGVGPVVRASVAQFLDLPAEERHALRSLAAEVEPGRGGMARARRRLRTQIAHLWVPFVRQRTGVSEAEAGALAWMLIAAAWSLSDTIADGTLGREPALDMFVRFVDSTLASWRSAPAGAAQPGTARPARALRTAPSRRRGAAAAPGRDHP